MRRVVGAFIRARCGTRMAWREHKKGPAETGPDLHNTGGASLSLLEPRGVAEAAGQST